MHYNLFTFPVDEEPVPGQNTWLEKGFALTDSLLKWAAANKMYLILDLHAAPGGQGHDLPIADRDSTEQALWESAAKQKKTVALWEKLAQRYKNEKWIGGYDLINEPNWSFKDPADRENHGCQAEDNDPLRKLYLQITEAIRSVDKITLSLLKETSGPIILVECCRPGMKIWSLVFISTGTKMIRPRYRNS